MSANQETNLNPQDVLRRFESIKDNFERIPETERPENPSFNTGDKVQTVTLMEDSNNNTFKIESRSTTNSNSTTYIFNSEGEFLQDQSFRNIDDQFKDMQWSEISKEEATKLLITISSTEQLNKTDLNRANGILPADPNEMVRQFTRWWA